VRRKKAKPALNQERILEDDLPRKILLLLSLYRGKIRLTLLRNIALLTHALLTLFQGARGGQGFLSQAALARGLPLASSGQPLSVSFSLVFPSQKPTRHGLTEQLFPSSNRRFSLPGLTEHPNSKPLLSPQK